MLDSPEQWGEWLFNSNALVVTLMLLIQDCNRSQDWTKPTEQIAEMLAKPFILLLRRKQSEESSRISRRLISMAGSAETHWSSFTNSKTLPQSFQRVAQGPCRREDT